MDAIRHQIHNVFKSTAEMVIPVLSSSAFQEKGVRLPKLVCFPSRHVDFDLNSGIRHSKLTTPVACVYIQVLTPEEFVVAGDMLVQSCPTWSW